MDSVALTRHFIVEESAPLTQYLLAQGFSPESITHLLQFGAIYLNKKRLTESLHVETGDYLRVHPAPKRYNTAQIDWTQRVLFEDPDYLIVNKPVGVPVHASLDNICENVVRCLETTRGEKLYVTQRLDVGTSGLIFLGRSPRAQTLFNAYLRERLVSKSYLALCSTAPSMGTLIHYMEPRDRAPHVVTPEEKENWKRCELSVQSVRPYQDFFEVEVKLITGRTHQVRVQLAQVGCPLVGDPIYGGVPYFRLALHGAKLEFKWKGVWKAFALEPQWDAEASPPLLESNALNTIRTPGSQENISLSAPTLIRS